MRVTSAALVVLLAGRAAAQSGEDKAAAEALFDEGRRLMDAGRAAEACPKFEASLRFDPALGALLNLAACHEEVGRTASAWARFEEAGDRAKRSGGACQRK